MPAQTTNLFLLQDLEDPGRTKNLADVDLKAMRTVADWIRTFVVRPHKDLGRAGPVCPFVPRACELRTLWFAPERIADRGVAGLVDLASDYRRLLLRAQPAEVDGANHNAIVVLLSDLPPDRADEYLGDSRITDLKRQSYAENGVVVGAFHPRNLGSAIRNPEFQPFKAPVPFLLMRHAVVNDWMFFLDDADWFGLWARRFGETAVPALAETMRHTNWRRVES